jgi:hypothetical protein
MEVGVIVMHRPLFPRERDPVPILQEAEGPSPVPEDGRGIPRTTGIPFPDCPVRNVSHYRLGYPGENSTCLNKY